MSFLCTLLQRTRWMLEGLDANEITSSNAGQTSAIHLAGTVF